MQIKPNTGCDNAMCRRRQAEWAAREPQRAVAAAAAAAAAAEEEAASGPVHETNEWGIEVMGDADEAAGEAACGSGATGGGSAAPGQALPEGLQFSMPAAGGVDAAALASEAVPETEAGVDDLMAQLELLSGGK